MLWCNSVYLKNGFKNDGLTAVRTDRNDSQRYTDEFADSFDVVTGSFRQFIIGLAVGNRRFPTRHIFVNRFDIFKDIEAGRIFFQLLALVFVSRADFNRIQVIKDIEAGNGQIIEAVQHGCVFYNSRIEPAAAAGTTGNGTEFVTRIAQVVTDFIELFSRERAGTDTRRIGFDDTDDVFHAARTDTGTGAGTAGRLVTKGYVP